jgi:hypothetical protein
VRIRFHRDEHVAELIAIGLRRRNIDVTTSVEAGLVGTSDTQQLAFAYSTYRLIVTHYARQNFYSASQILQRIILIHDTVTAEDMHGEVEYL